MRIALRTLFFFFLVAFAFSAKAQPIFDKSETPWADSLLATLSVEEKIGQLFMVAAYSNRAR